MKKLFMILALMLASVAGNAQCTKPTIYPGGTYSNERLYFSFTNNGFVWGAVDSVRYTSNGTWKSIIASSTYGAYVPAPSGTTVKYVIAYYCSNPPKVSDTATYTATTAIVATAPSSVTAHIADGGWFVRDTAVSTCACGTYVHKAYLVTSKGNVLATTDTMTLPYMDHSFCILQRFAKNNGVKNTAAISYVFGVQSMSGGVSSSETLSTPFLFPDQQCIDGK